MRTSITSAIACLVTLVFLWHTGPWLLIALLPYGAAYASYRGSVVAAQSYGVTMSAVIALNRFSLYEQLHIPLPATTSRERMMNKELMDLLRHTEKVSLKYRHPNSSKDP